jgi:hypothetical protein
MGIMSGNYTVQYIRHTVQMWYARLGQQNNRYEKAKQITVVRRFNGDQSVLKKRRTRRNNTRMRDGDDDGTSLRNDPEGSLRLRWRRGRRLRMNKIESTTSQSMHDSSSLPSGSPSA